MNNSLLVLPTSSQRVRGNIDFVALQRANSELSKVASSAGLTAVPDPLRDPGVAAGDGGVVGASSLVDGALGDSTPFGRAQPFEYVPDLESGEVQELAASTANPDQAARMLGYGRDEFGNMIHVMKKANGLRGNENVVWHDNGDVYFKGIPIDNMHNY